MLLLLSPAKTLDYETPLPPALLARAEAPRFLREAAELIELLKTRSAAQVSALMSLSPALAELNVGRYAAWSPTSGPDNARPALRAFAGDVYTGLDAASLPRGAIDWLQQHLVMLSGLYGALRPLDWLQPYRLEMGTPLPNRRGGNLYAFWGERLAGYLDERLRDEPRPVVVNLASQEYAKAVDRGALRARWVDCVFEEAQHGTHKVVGVHAKRARGLMARYAALKRAKTPRALQGFDLEGYAYDAAASTPDRLVFRRDGGR